MSDHPIEALMKTAMESIKEMVDVNTVVGDPVETPDGTVICRFQSFMRFCCRRRRI